ncbi:MAG: CDP-alcohol phosphatidyltransferase family protein [Actinobacteria bacterium]|nr:CDP-alcohol phosphatidyltransferase family protein [Actinomycetota bacterium]
MLSKTKAKNISTAIAHPFAVLFIKLRISADVITFIGTLGVCLTSVIYFSRGQFLIGSLLFTFFVGFDALDGTMARMLNKKSKWGAFFDSVMDRIADGVVLASISYYFLIQQENLLFIVSLVALISSEIVSYTKARAEGFSHQILSRTADPQNPGKTLMDRQFSMVKKASIKSKDEVIASRKTT